MCARVSTSKGTTSNFLFRQFNDRMSSSLEHEIKNVMFTLHYSPRSHIRSRRIVGLYRLVKQLYRKNRTQVYKYMYIIWAYRNCFPDLLEIYKAWYYMRWSLWHHLEAYLSGPRVEKKLTRKWKLWFKNMEKQKIEIPSQCSEDYEKWLKQDDIIYEIQKSLACKEKVIQILRENGFYL